MKQTSKFSPLLSAKFIILVVLGFLIPLAISIFVGTRSFNFYCSKALAGENIGSYIFRDLEKSGFKDCILNTPTLSLYVFMLTLYAAVFSLHAFLISQLEEKNCLKNLARILLICLLFNFLFYASSSFFQRIDYGFLEGGVSITSGTPRWLFSFSGMRTTLIPQLIFWLALTFFISQAGLIIMTFLLNRFKLSYGYKPGAKSFLYVFVGAALFQLLTLVIAFSIFSLFVRTTSRNPVVHQFPQSPGQVFSLGNHQSRDASWKKYHNENYQFEIEVPQDWDIRKTEHYTSIYKPDTKTVEYLPSFYFQNKEKVNLVTPEGPHGSVFQIALHPASDFSSLPQGVEKEVVGGMEAQCYRSTENIIFDCWVWINRDDYFFRLTGYATNQLEKIQNSQTLEKILASFKIR